MPKLALFTTSFIRKRRTLHAITGTTLLTLAITALIAGTDLQAATKALAIVVLAHFVRLVT